MPAQANGPYRNVYNLDTTNTNTLSYTWATSAKTTSCPLYVRYNGVVLDTFILADANIDYSDPTAIWHSRTAPFTPSAASGVLAITVEYPAGSSLQVYLDNIEFLLIGDGCAE